MILICIGWWFEIENEYNLWYDVEWEIEGLCEGDGDEYFLFIKIRKSKNYLRIIRPPHTHQQQMMLNILIFMKVRKNKYDYLKMEFVWAWGDGPSTESTWA